LPDNQFFNIIKYTLCWIIKFLKFIY
jgi:hypothetical protein